MDHVSSWPFKSHSRPPPIPPNNTPAQCDSHDLTISDWSVTCSSVNSLHSHLHTTKLSGVYTSVSSPHLTSLFQSSLPNSQDWRREREDSLYNCGPICDPKDGKDKGLYWVNTTPLASTPDFKVLLHGNVWLRGLWKGWERAPQGPVARNFDHKPVHQG